MFSSFRCAAAVLLIGNLSIGAAAQAVDDGRVGSLLAEAKRLEERVAGLEQRRAAFDSERLAERLETRILAMTEDLGEAPRAHELAIRWDGDFVFASDDKSTRLRIVGLVQNDLSFGTQDGSLEDSGIGRIEDGFRFRRVRLGVAGLVAERVEFAVRFDFAQGDADVTEMFIGIVDLGDVVTGVRIGHQKEPFGLEQLTAAPGITFVERSPANALAPGRNNGIVAYGAPFEERMTWAAGLFRETDDFGDNEAGATRPEDGKYAVTVRLTGLPLWDNKGEKMVHVGAGFSYRNSPRDRWSVSQRPDHRFAPNFVSTGNLDADDVVLIGAEAAAVIGLFSLQGEALYAAVDGYSRSDADPEFFAWYVEASWMLTGESRPYSRKKGAFEKVRGDSRFLDDAGGSGAWQIALRYSELDLTSDAVEGGRLQSLTGGLNWYLNATTRVALNYTWAELDEAEDGDEGSAHLFTIGFQFDF